MRSTLRRPYARSARSTAPGICVIDDGHCLCRHLSSALTCRHSPSSVSIGSCVHTRSFEGGRCHAEVQQSVTPLNRHRRLRARPGRRAVRARCARSRQAVGRLLGPLGPQRQRCNAGPHQGVGRQGESRRRRRLHHHASQQAAADRRGRGAGQDRPRHFGPHLLPAGALRRAAGAGQRPDDRIDQDERPGQRPGRVISARSAASGSPSRRRRAARSRDPARASTT